MTFTDEQKAALAAPLDRAKVKSRTQSGQTLSYIEAWHAIAEANRIFGFDGWTRELISLAQVADAYQSNGKWRVAYRATVRITAGPVIRDGTGYGSGIGNDLNDAHESAVKEAESDAMKRALMTFGNPFGLALYDKTQANVEDATPARRPAARPDAEPGSKQETAEQWIAWGRAEAAKFADMDVILLKQWNADNAKNGRLAKLERLAPDAHAEIGQAYRERLAELSPNLRAAG